MSNMLRTISPADNRVYVERALATGRHVLPPSSLYAYAAFRAGAAFVDFTPSTGARLPALEALAEQRGVPHAGRSVRLRERQVVLQLGQVPRVVQLRVQRRARHRQ